MKCYLVSIVMPAYNAEAYIEESIKSVLEQTFREWELIVIDDGSKDNTSLIVKKYTELDDRIRYIYQENKKLPAARNTGIRHSTSPFIAFLDADDLWYPEKLEKQVAILNQNDTCALVYTNGEMIDESSNIFQRYPSISGLFRGDEMYRLQFSANYIPVLSVLVRKSWIDIIGEQDETLVYGCEDWDYWLRMARKEAIFVGIDEKLFKYRVHSGGMSRNISYMRFAEFSMLFRNIDYHFIEKAVVYERLSALIDNHIFLFIDSKNKQLLIKMIKDILNINWGIKYLGLYFVMKILPKPSRTIIHFFMKCCKKLSIC